MLNCSFSRLITKYDNVSLQFTTARPITICENVLLQWLVITILHNCYNKRQILQFATLLQFTTEHNDFPHRKSYWENVLFNRLACKRYFNTSLRLLYNSFWLRTWLWKLGNMAFFKICLKFYTSPQLSFNISYTYEPISTESSAHFSEMNEQLLK